VMRRDKESEEDKILKELKYIKHRINASSGILTDKEKTAFYFVLVPEEMIILDTQKAAGLFAKYVPLSGYIVNRIIPPELASENIPEYLRNRMEMQKKYLEEIKNIFGNEVLTQVPEFERDITGLPMIERVANALFEGKE